MLSITYVTVRGDSSLCPYLICMERDTPEATPENVTERRCSICGDEKLYDVANWPMKYGRPDGSVCRLCSRKRKRAFDRSAKQERAAARTAGVATLTETSSALPAALQGVSTGRGMKPGELPLRQLDVAKALRVGAAALNENAQGILVTVFEYAMNANSVHHEWALKLIAERIIPRKLFEDLGLQAAGVKPGQGAMRPAVTIIVQPAAAPGPVESSVKVIEGEVIRDE